jgi:hypothetical protein
MDFDRSLRRGGEKVFSLLQGWDLFCGPPAKKLKKPSALKGILPVQNKTGRVPGRLSDLILIVSSWIVCPAKFEVVFVGARQCQY